MTTRPILLATLLLATLPAFAQQATPEPVAPPAPTMDEPQPVPTQEAAPADKVATADHDVADRTCLRETGTLIRARGSRDAKGCIPGAAGRAYTQDDLRMTGQTDIASALRMLDPAIR